MFGFIKIMIGSLEIGALKPGEYRTILHSDILHK